MCHVLLSLSANVNATAGPSLTLLYVTQLDISQLEANRCNTFVVVTELSYVRNAL